MVTTGIEDCYFTIGWLLKRLEGSERLAIEISGVKCPRQM